VFIQLHTRPFNVAHFAQKIMWLKLTEHLKFNQILPIDWKNTYAMKLLLPYLIGDKKQRTDKNQSINNSDSLDVDSSLETTLGDQLDDQFVLSSYGYEYSTCRLHHSITDYYDKRLDDSLNQTNNNKNNYSSYLNEFENDLDFQLARDLDFHSLILCSNASELNDDDDGKQLLFTAEEVLKELDIILAEDDNQSTGEQSMDNSSFYTSYLNETDELDGEIAKETLLNSTILNNNNKIIKPNLLRPFNGYSANSIGTSFSSSSLCDDLLSSGHSMSRSQTSSSQISSGIDNGGSYSSYTQPKSQTEIENEKQLFENQLRTLNITQLNEIYLDLERMIQNHSEILISELALKDELEYEKELKNQFISLLICIQNKRRKQNLSKKNNNQKVNTSSAEQGAKYLTTVIPYNSALGPPDARTLQILIKILKAINEDSPTVPTLLTDFILKIICPQDCAR